MSKMQITIGDSGHVELAYTEADSGDQIARTFTCPVDGGYVREFKTDGDLKQVCDKLSSQGSTLMASSRATLADVIRREYKAMRASEKRDEARY